MPGLEQILDRILVSIAEGKHRNQGTQLTAFFPIKGSLASGELMVIGRAVNGWGDGWHPGEANDASKRQAIVANLLKSNRDVADCPMSWIRKRWGFNGLVCRRCEGEFCKTRGTCINCSSTSSKKGYNTAKSAFWRVIRNVLEKLSPGQDFDKEWPSHLIWSDLYKVAPYKGGNPTHATIMMQQENCIAMLQEEILLWKPHRILFLTGYDWAEPFLNYLGVQEISRPNGLVSYVGLLGKPNAQSTVVVAPHPQGKKEQQIAREILAGFGRLGEPAGVQIT